MTRQELEAKLEAQIAAGQISEWDAEMEWQDWMHRNEFWQEW